MMSNRDGISAASIAMKRSALGIFSLLLLAPLIVAVPAWSEVSESSPRMTPTVKAVARTLPSVVNISTERIVTQRTSPYGFGDPFSELFNRFFGYQERHYKTSSLGSGVIVDSGGLILTNNHVIQRASKIIITLDDQSSFEAKPIATDEANDIALLKIESTDPPPVLAAIEFGAPGDLLLGEPVISVGNPFGLGHSIATGVVSAIGRKVIYNGKVLFDDIVQTDAAINPGNSGGPIVNADGQLIGVNLAIYGDAEGIGFAIPLSRIETVLSSWLTPSRFGLNECGFLPGTRLAAGGQRQAVVAHVVPQGPAAKAGLKEGDVVSSVNETVVRQAIDVGRILWKMKNGDPVTLVLADGRQISFVVESIPELSSEEWARDRLRVELQELTGRLADALGLPYSRGLVVSDIAQDSALGKQGVRRGDVIRQVGETPVANFTDLYRALSKYERGDLVQFIVDRVETAQGHLLLQRFALNVPL